MTYQTTPHEERFLKQYPITRMDNRQHQANAGKGATFTLKVNAYPDGTLYLLNPRHQADHEPYDNKQGRALESAGEAFKVLCERAIAQAQAQQPTE